MGVIQIKNLTKDFGHNRGVFNINIDINKGECFGYLGPNGAGKSTTIRQLMGFTRPDSGACYINGIDVSKDRVRAMQEVSYIPGELALPNQLTGDELIEINKELKGVTSDTFLNYLKDYFQLNSKIKVKEMSLGMKRKLAIVLAFINDPNIIIMDEPSSGLDPDMQDKFISLIKAEKERGKTILLSSHIFREVDVSCDRITIIKDGHLVSTFLAKDLKHNSTKTYKINLKDLKSYSLFLKESKTDFKIVDHNKEDKSILLSCDDNKISSLVDLLSKFKILDFKEKKETLEDYFMHFYKEDRTYKGV